MQCNLFGVKRSAGEAAAAHKALLLLVVALVVGITLIVYRSCADIAPELTSLSRTWEQEKCSRKHGWSDTMTTTCCLWVTMRPSMAAVLAGTVSKDMLLVSGFSGDILLLLDFPWAQEPRQYGLESFKIPKTPGLLSFAGALRRNFVMANSAWIWVHESQRAPLVVGQSTSFIQGRIHTRTDAKRSATSL